MGNLSKLHAFLTSALDGGEWSDPCPSVALLPEKEPRHPLDMRLGEPQSRSERGGEEKDTLPLPENETQWVVSFMPPAALLPRKEAEHPLDMRLGGPQSRSERGDK
jgi:hypothetical protein